MNSFGNVVTLFTLLAVAGSAHAQATGTEQARGRAQRAVAKTFASLDRVNGGVFHAGTQEKLAMDQAVTLRTYAAAWRDWNGTSFRAAAVAVDRYVEQALTSPEGAFYAGETDKRIVARDNAAMIVALTELFAATGDPMKIGRAVRAARFLKSVKGGDGGYGSPEDTLAMTGAAIALYQATGSGEWLDEARALAHTSESMVLGNEARAELAAYEHALSVIDWTAGGAVAQY